MAKIFYLCDGEVPECTKTMCYKKETSEKMKCKHTSDINHAINFVNNKNRSFYEKETDHKNM